MKLMIAIPQLRRAMIALAITAVDATTTATIIAPRLSLGALFAKRHPHPDVFGQNEVQPVPVTILTTPLTGPLF
jgi:hypothetical protein